MLRAASLLLVFAIACESELDKARAAAAKACEGGDGQQCFVAAVGLDGPNPKELDRGVTLWTRARRAEACLLGDPSSCERAGMPSPK